MYSVHWEGQVPRAKRTNEGSIAFFIFMFKSEPERIMPWTGTAAVDNRGVSSLEDWRVKHDMTIGSSKRWCQGRMLRFQG